MDIPVLPPALFVPAYSSRPPPPDAIFRDEFVTVPWDDGTSHHFQVQVDVGVVNRHRKWKCDIPGGRLIFTWTPQGVRKVTARRDVANGSGPRYPRVVL